MPSEKTGPQKRKIPLRACIGCRESRPKLELIRIVRTPEGAVVVDSKKGKLNGRGAYVCPTIACFDQAIRKKAFDHTLHVHLSIDDTNAVKDGFIKRLMEAPSNSETMG